MSPKLLKIKIGEVFAIILLALGLLINTLINGNSYANTINSCDFSKADSIQKLSSDTTLAKKDSLSTDDDGALKSKVKYSCKDSLLFNVDGKTVYLFGNAEITYEDINLKAPFIEIDWENNIISAFEDTLGNKPLFSQGDQKFKASTIRYNFKTKKGKISGVSTQEGEGFIHGESVKKDSSNSLYIRNGKYTTCNEEQPHFYIKSNKIKVIQSDKVITGPAVLTIADVPTPLMIPFGFFPNKRGQSSGILFPAVGESAQFGFSLENGGYYFGLGDHANLAIRTKLYSKGNYNVDLNSAYNVRYRYQGNIGIGYSYTKNSYKELPDYSSNKSYLVRWVHSQDPRARPGLTFNANVNFIGSSYFQKTLSVSPTDYLSNTFSSSITLAKNWKNKPYNFLANVFHSQNTKTHRIDFVLPSLLFNVNRQYPFKKRSGVSADNVFTRIGYNYSTNFKNTLSTYDSTLFTNRSVDLMKSTVSHDLPFSTSAKVLKYFTLSPSLVYSEDWAFKSFDTKWNSDSMRVETDTTSGFSSLRTLTFNTSLNTFLYGLVQFKKGPVKGIRHVFNPSVTYSYRPDYTTSFWNYYQHIQYDSSGNKEYYSRFETSPGIGRSSALNFTLGNQLDMKTRIKTDSGETDKKYKILESLSISGGYDFAKDSLNLSENIVISARTTLFERLTINFSGNWNPYVVDSKGRSQKEFLVDKTGKLATLRSANISGGFSLNSAAKQEKKNDKYSEDQLRYINQNLGQFVDFSVPWNLTANFGVVYTKQYGVKSGTTARKELVPSLSFNADVNLTSKWKVSASSSYDFETKEFVYPNINIFRDLHCWQMQLNWIPYGQRQSYSFQINVKSSVLQDLKLMKRNPPALF